MTSTAGTARNGNGGAPGFLDRERIIAKPGFNRWLVPPAALAIHLCIGMSYGLSVFWRPLEKAIGITAPVVCENMTVLEALFTTTCDWRRGDLVLIFTIGIVFLGLSAAVFGGWLERAGPRKAGVAAALCWGGGFILSAVGVYLHQLWLMWLGLGVLGGIGLGLGYISPVSTLIKWFPDRRGMATGMAIMGFGGGAMIGSLLANALMAHFTTATSVGVAEAMAAIGAVYIVFMLGGAFGYRITPDGWRPDGWTPPQDAAHAMITTGNVHLDNAHKTPQFWFIWIVLCMNVSAGIGVLATASPMLQEIFGGALIGLPGVGIKALDAAQVAAVAGVAAGFVALLSLFNSFGRFLWASFSDYIGRKNTYYCFFILGMLLYASAPTLAQLGLPLLFVAAFCIILTMYGGGFATVPAYLADIFGTQFVGAIHGRLLTAWSTAGVLGPLAVVYIQQAQKDAGVELAQSYNYTMYILVGFLFVGLLANLLIRPVADKWLMSDEELAAAKLKVSSGAAETGSFGIGLGGLSFSVVLAWLAVGIPFIWGVTNTLQKAVVLFLG
jgi:MFS family permease